MKKYPEGRQPGSDAERVYHSALLLAAGQVEQADLAVGADHAEHAFDVLDVLGRRLQRLGGEGVGEQCLRVLDRDPAALQVEERALVDPADRRDRKSTRLNSSHSGESRMPSSA